MKLLIIDGQGGRLGKLFVDEILRKIPHATIYALGTNSIATATMLKSGAHHGATGENPIVRNVRDATAIFGPVGIVVAHSILGEVTPAMAEHIGGADAKKYLIPMNGCGVIIAGVTDRKLKEYVEQAVDLFLNETR